MNETTTVERYHLLAYPADLHGRGYLYIADIENDKLHSLHATTEITEQDRSTLQSIRDGARPFSVHATEMSVWTVPLQVFYRNWKASLTAPEPVVIEEQPTRELALERQVAVLREELERAQAPITDAADDRLAPIWEEANRVADDRGYCSVFDELAREIGAPGRERSWDVETEITITFTATVSTTANSEDDAIANVDSMTYSDVWQYLNMENVSHYDISNVDGQSAEHSD